MKPMVGLDPRAIAARLSDEEAFRLAAALMQAEKDEARQKWQHLFPDEGPLRRELYPKHMEFFAAGAKYHERLFMAANRIGKTVAAGFEVSCHLTGRYPDWWEGRRFNGPVDLWAAGDTTDTTRDIIQKQLFGDITYEGSERTFDGVGIIPHELYGKPRFKTNSGGLLDFMRVKHVSGRWSTVGLRSYDQGRKVFQGTEKHVIWLDEEPSMDVYNECLLRTTTTGGIVILSFTPLLGMSEVVRSFLQPEVGETDFA